MRRGDVGLPRVVHELDVERVVRAGRTRLRPAAQARLVATRAGRLLGDAAGGGAVLARLPLLPPHRVVRLPARLRLSDAARGAGGAAAGAGAAQQPQSAGPQDHGDGQLLLPQLNRLHEAYKRSPVASSASSSSQDQQPPKPTIPTQKRVTQQLSTHWSSFKVLRQRYAGSRFAQQLELHLPQKHKATEQDSTLRVEMNGLEEQADNAKPREL